MKSSFLIIMAIELALLAAAVAPLIKDYPGK